MIFLKNYFTELMILLVMVCITLQSIIHSLIIFNFSFVFKISPFLLKFHSKFHNKNMQT